MKKFLKLLPILLEIPGLLEEAREAFEVVQKKVNDPEVLKEINDVIEKINKIFPKKPAAPVDAT